MVGGDDTYYEKNVGGIGSVRLRIVSAQRETKSERLQLMREKISCKSNKIRHQYVLSSEDRQKVEISYGNSR